jgi:hypothetical protein
MAWQGKSLTEICQQIKDPKRDPRASALPATPAKPVTLRRTIRRIASLPRLPAPAHELVLRHMLMKHLEGLVAVAPGDQKTFGELIHAWIESGAECP